LHISPLLNKFINPIDIEVNRDYVGYVFINSFKDTPKLAPKIKCFAYLFRCHSGGLSPGPLMVAIEQ